MKHVLITGASTGIGKDCAIYLAERGFHVFAGVRKESDFEALSKTHKNLDPITIDVLKVETIQSALKTVEEIVKPEDSFALMNNAGIVKPGPMEHLPWEDFAFQMETNVTAQLRTTQAFLPLLRKVKDGRILFTGSQSGFFTSPLMGAYCASKHAIEALADALRRELEITSNIKVSLLQPGQIKTPIWNKSLDKADEIRTIVPEQTREKYQNVVEQVILRAEDASTNGAPTEEVSKCVYHALSSSKPKTRYRMGRGAKSTYFLSKVLGDRTVDKLIRKALKL